ncbi:MAG: right-handed parallel beta-helix repeat-containing protein [Acidobacteria bacterium]|nr:right-handed parallel beta-helix repeat-containing protein [Acidobacteriota bacterium]
MSKSLAAGLVILAIFLFFTRPQIPWARSASHAGVYSCKCSASALPQTAAKTVFYVATDGNDAWSGKLDKPNAGRTDGPFRTVQRAQKAIRDLKANGPLKEPVTVYIRRGQYDLAKPLEFTPEDSGTPQAPVTYAAYPGETPVLSGGKEITGWKRVTDRKLVAQAGGELWMAHVPEVKEGKWYFRELFVNGHRRQRARTPNTGFFLVDGKISSGKQATFKFHQGDIQPQWAAQGHVEVVALQAWAEFRMYIRGVDEATHTVTLSRTPAPSNREDNARYCVENTMDALDAPGEWYLDRRRGILYYRPEPGEKMDHVRVIAPVLEQLVRFEGRGGTGWVHDIRLCGLTLSYTDWSMGPNGYVDLQAAYDIPAAVEGMGTRSCDIEKCTFAHLGGYAVEFGGGAAKWWGIRQGSKGDRVIGNDMYDLGAGGVKIGDPTDPNSDDQATDGNVISDNHIHDIGLVYPAAVGIWVGESSNNAISHNEIDDTYYTGISVGWTWGYKPTAAKANIIEFNNIYNIGRGMLSDMGCIYTLGVQPGTVERNNLCHDVSRYRYGGWGLYTDEGSSDIVIENNVVYRTEDGGFHQNYGANNIIRNNIFAYGKEAQIRRSRDESHLSFTFEHNIVYWNHGPLFQGVWANNEYHFDHNLYFRTDGRPIRFGKWSFAEWQARGQDRHSLIADPLFVDPSQGDFALKPGSPAYGIGFKPIDLSKIGPQ